MSTAVKSRGTVAGSARMRSRALWAGVIFAAGVAAFLGGAVATTTPVVVMLPLLLACLAFCLVNGTFRLAAVILGALVVFQSSSQVSASKVVYAGFLACVVGVSLLEVIRRRDGVRTDVPRVVIAGLFLALALSMTLPISLSRGTSGSVWLRDYGTYALIGLGPFLGFAAVRHAGARRVRGLAIVCALVSATGFAVDWLNRRGISALSLDRLALGSGSLVALGFALLIAMAVMKRRTTLSVLGAVYLGVSQFVTGTRSSLVFLAAPLAIVIARRVRFGDWRALRVLGAVVVLTVIAVPLTAQLLTSNGGYLEQRLTLGVQSISGSLSSDQSFEQRAWAYDQARQSISSYPLLGTGLGYQYEGFAGKPATITLDTPLISVAKLGLVGTAAMLVYLIVLTVWLWKQSRGDPVLEFTVAGFAAVVVASIPLGSPLEDKGLGLALMLLTAMVLVPRKPRVGEPADADVDVAQPSSAVMIP